jgi:hypothetical protein
MRSTLVPLLGAAASSPIIDSEYTSAWSLDGSRIAFTGSGAVTP